MAALNHPHICTLHDVGPNYLVMELVDGQPLVGPLPLARALEFASQILSALDAAHRQGITHRDLKPANILVTKQGVKLLAGGCIARRTRHCVGDWRAGLDDMVSPRGRTPFAEFPSHAPSRE